VLLGWGGRAGDDPLPQRLVAGFHRRVHVRRRLRAAACAVCGVRCAVCGVRCSVFSGRAGGRADGGAGGRSATVKRCAPASAPPPPRWTAVYCVLQYCALHGHVFSPRR
jgi:hypothetical protein